MDSWSSILDPLLPLEFEEEEIECPSVCQEGETFSSSNESEFFDDFYSDEFDMLIDSLETDGFECE